MRTAAILLLSVSTLFSQGTTGIGVRNPASLMATYQILYPTQVVDLVEWFAADQGVYKDAGVTLAANGETVQQWNDLSGNGNHVGQATAGARPLYLTGVLNGLPVLSGNGASWMSNTFTPAKSTVVTVICCFLYSNKAEYGICDGGGSTFTQTKMYPKASGSFAFASSLTGERLAFTGSSNTWYVITWSPQTNQYFGYCRAFLYSKMVLNFLPGTGAEKTQDGTTLMSLVTGIEPMKGKMAEFMMYSRPLTNLERYGLEMYLKWKYALQDPF